MSPCASLARVLCLPLSTPKEPVECVCVCGRLTIHMEPAQQTLSICFQAANIVSGEHVSWAYNEREHQPDFLFLSSS